MHQNMVTPNMCRNKKQSEWTYWMHIYLSPGFKNRFIAKNGYCSENLRNSKNVWFFVKNAILPNISKIRFSG